MPGAMKRRIQFEDCAGSPLSCDRRFVELNAGAGSDLLIGPAVIDEQLAAVFREGREMGIEVVHVLVDVIRLCCVTLQVEGSPVPVGIVIDDVAELVQKKIGRLRAAGEASPAQFGAGLKARE